jgi:2-iminoacetate synthase
MVAFLEELALWPADRIRELVRAATPEDVTRALNRERLTGEDLAALLSPEAGLQLEAMAQAAKRLTRRYFGRVISLYAPIYLSNVCASDCIYCGYAVRSTSPGKRRTLKAAEIRAECASLTAYGFQNVLLLTGDAPLIVPVRYIAEAVTIAREYFPSVSVEVYALDQADYEQLVAQGLEGVTLFMETYHRETYSRVHLHGKKQDYEYRLGASERAGRAGARRLGLGALLGLYDWRLDGFWTALHARYLQKECWQSAITVSFPRLKGSSPRFTVPHLLVDREFVQLILATRLFLPEAGINLSTREPAGLRDGLIPLGVTIMSAGSSTRPGGYSQGSSDILEQFATVDNRSPAEVAAAIRRAGYDPVWKDFDQAFLGTAGLPERSAVRKGSACS